MPNTINENAIATVLRREYERDLTRAYKIIPFAERKYEGDISAKGQTVEVPFLTVGDWNTEADIDPNRDIPKGDITIGTHTMTVNQYHDIRLTISEKEMSQLGKDMKTTQEVARQLRLKASTIQEDYFLGKILGATIPDDSAIAGVALDDSNIYTEMLRIRKAMNDQNVPAEDRRIFVSSTVGSILLANDRLTGLNAGYEQQSSGEIGMIAGFTVVESNALTGDNDLKIVGYQGKAANFVEKLNFIKVKEADSGNYYNILGGLFYDADVLGVGLKKIAIYTGA